MTGFLISGCDVLHAVSIAPAKQMLDPKQLKSEIFMGLAPFSIVALQARIAKGARASPFSYHQDRKGKKRPVLRRRHAVLPS
jgi:hypothetical protein